jgi:hypothetical protein
MPFDEAMRSLRLFAHDVIGATALTPA